MKLSICAALFVLPLLGTAVAAEEFALPDLTLEQPSHRRTPAAPGKAPALGAPASQWVPENDDKAAKAFTPKPDFCDGCELKLKAQHITREDRLRRPLEDFE